VGSCRLAPQEHASRFKPRAFFHQELQPFAHGLYVNQLGETSEELVRSGYGPNYSRLAEIKKKYDPVNLLRLNQNIKPTQSARKIWQVNGLP
jgi:hypothetical protein